MDRIPARPPSSRKRQTAAALLALLVSGGCSDVRDLTVLQYGLSQEYGMAAGVGLTNGLILTVTLADSALVEASCERQAGAALEAARYVRRYEHFDSLQSVSVSIVRPRPSGRGTEPPTHLPFRFPRTALQTGRLAADSANAVAMCRMETESR